MDYSGIKEEYRKLHNELLSMGKLPLKDTGIGFWAVAVPDDIKHLFDRIRLKRYRSFVDLGSGDGRVALIASLYTKSAGIELDRELHEYAVRIKYALGSSAILFNEDYMGADLKHYDLAFIHPDKSMLEIERKLKSEFKGTLVVYGDDFLPVSLKKKDSFIAHSTPVHLYEV